MVALPQGSQMPAEPSYPLRSEIPGWFSERGKMIVRRLTPLPERAAPWPCGRKRRAVHECMNSVLLPKKISRVARPPNNRRTIPISANASELKFHKARQRDRRVLNH
jgi:hypothetical protein